MKDCSLAEGLSPKRRTVPKSENCPLYMKFILCYYVVSWSDIC